ncbi:MAG TPA: hypothetical protein VLC09_10995 [Polyangiaceae bacterium]|nr:hypothetical protein [Polyangiaceae bacterium]
MHWRGWWLLLLLPSCGGLSAHGGNSLSADATRAMQARATYRALRCEREDGSIDAGWSDERMDLVPAGERELLLIRRPGYESWLVEPAFRAEGEQVYQLSLEGPDGLWLLRDVRLREDRGRMALVEHWTEERGQGSVRAHFSRAQVTCELTRSTAEER